MKEEFLRIKLSERREKNAYRQLRLTAGKTDFCSNDYLGIARNWKGHGTDALKAGSGGSRLLAGNYTLIEETEKQLAVFHEAEAALIFNSGYDANTGLLSSVPQRADIILYDFLSHASIRDGIRLSLASSFSFRHNDLGDLEKRLKTIREQGQGVGLQREATESAGTTASASETNVFIVTESVFSMDGDLAPLREMILLCERYHAYLIVDEAHATGIIGNGGEGLVQQLGIASKCFARVHTFGKAVGCHGAAVLGSQDLRDFLINFSRSFIYTTALPESSIAAIATAYQMFPGMQQERNHLNNCIAVFREADLPYTVLESSTPIQGVIVPGNEAVRRLAQHLQDNNLDVRPILSPTVPAGGERLRIVLHAFNTLAEVRTLIQKIAYF